MLRRSTVILACAIVSLACVACKKSEGDEGGASGGGKPSTASPEPAAGVGKRMGVPSSHSAADLNK